MGRSAGHLAFGIGSACHYPMIVIPEMFNKTEITVEKIVNLVVSSIIKRKIMGIDYGVAMISEGVFHALSDEEIKKSGIHFSYDEHGHPELGKVSKAHIFNEMLENKLKRTENQGKVASRRDRLRSALPDSDRLRSGLLLGVGHGRLQTLLGGQDGLHGLHQPGRLCVAALSQRLAGSRHGQDSAPVWSISTRTRSSR